MKNKRLTYNRIGFFVLGTFLGGYVLGFLGGILGRR